MIARKQSFDIGARHSQPIVAKTFSGDDISMYAHLLYPPNVDQATATMGIDGGISLEIALGNLSADGIIGDRATVAEGISFFISPRTIVQFLQVIFLCIV